MTNFATAVREKAKLVSIVETWPKIGQGELIVHINLSSETMEETERHWKEFGGSILTEVAGGLLYLGGGRLFWGRRGTATLCYEIFSA